MYVNLSYSGIKRRQIEKAIDSILLQSTTLMKATCTSHAFARSLTYENAIPQNAATRRRCAELMRNMTKLLGYHKPKRYVPSTTLKYNHDAIAIRPTYRSYITKTACYKLSSVLNYQEFLVDIMTFFMLSFIKKKY